MIDLLAVRPAQADRLAGFRIQIIQAVINAAQIIEHIRRRNRRKAVFRHPFPDLDLQFLHRINSRQPFLGFVYPVRRVPFGDGVQESQIVG